MAISSSVHAQVVLQLHRTDGVVLVTDITSTDSVNFDGSLTKLCLHMGKSTGELPIDQLDSITFGEKTEGIRVVYGEDRITVSNPYAFKGVEVNVTDNRQVQVVSQLSEEITYTLSGKGCGSFKLYSPSKQKIILQSLELTAADGPALNIQSKKKTTVMLPEGTHSLLRDAATYTPVGDEDMKGTFFSEGDLIFQGDGSLEVTGFYKHAICSDDDIELQSGHVSVASAASDAMHGKGNILISGGEFSAAGTQGDGIDCEGFLSISGGSASLTMGCADTKALSSDSTLTISGGQLNLTLKADQTKGIKSKSHVLISGGTMDICCEGGVVVMDGDPSYCTAVKSDSSIVVSGGEITIRHTGEAGKGLSAETDLLITGGDLTIETTGNGSTYTTASGTSDTYSSICIKSDGTLRIEAGKLVLSASGSGGKCVSSDGVLTIGTETGGPDLTAITTGSKIGTSSSGGWNQPGSAPQGGGGGGGFGPGGGFQPGNNSGTGGNPKAIKGEADVTVNGGNIEISTSQDGGEGLESKSTLTINGGTIHATTYDDALNAAQSLVINGGRICVVASGNDGIDSNGTITINGGTVISAGNTSPEEGFDCDQNTFLINGGTVVGVGGSTSMPSSASLQNVALYSGGSGSNGTTYTLTDAAGVHLLSFTLPKSYNSMTMLLSSPQLLSSNTYNLMTGGNVTGGDTFYGLCTGGQFSDGSTLKTFTTSSRVTQVR